MKFYSWGQVKLTCFLKTNSFINLCETSKEIKPWYTVLFVNECLWS